MGISEHDILNAATSLLDKATTRKITISVAESCTGGMLSFALTEIAGSSAVFDRGYVTYSNAAKIDMLDVRAQTLERFGAVSEQIAVEMVQGVFDKSGCDLCISITGIAGPGGSEFKPEGRVCFGTLIQGGTSASETIEFGAKGRAQVRKLATLHALNRLLEMLATSPD